MVWNDYTQVNNLRTEFENLRTKIENLRTEFEFCARDSYNQYYSQQIQNTLKFSFTLTLIANKYSMIAVYLNLSVQLSILRSIFYCLLLNSDRLKDSVFQSDETCQASMHMD